MAQEGYDKLMNLTDSRYRLSMVVGRRAAQIKNGIPSTLKHEEYPKTRNTVTIALKELVMDKGIHWGKDMPKLEDLKKTLEQDRKLQNAQANYTVSNAAR
ncbi:MAG: DNA-directed RNA polymerase subunit omega [Trueperaceae bacterium]|nr:DNA-directed RNA polymerase subunit omega [Trueperaceae bacterium]